jgi:hypothetical protein
MIVHAARPRAAGAAIPAEGFLRHRGLLLVATAGAVAEAGLLTLLAPAARPLAPQATALPVLAAYHDLRWLFADSQSSAEFAALLTAVLLARAVVDTVLLRLAWPQALRAPRISRAFWSSLALTVLAWLLLSPSVTLAFGVAVLPFSWPFLAALPIMGGIAIALSHGGVNAAWWRRLPPPRSVLWLLVSLVVLSAAAAVIAHLGTAAAIAVAGVTGLANARAWYGIASIAARQRPRARESVPARLLSAVPVAALAGLIVIALVVGAARLMFTGTIQLPTGSSTVSTSSIATAVIGRNPAGGNESGASSGAGAAGDVVLVVGGWGSSCCDAADGLSAALAGATVRQFSYAGLDARGRPLPSGPSVDDLPLPVLGDRMAAQLEKLHDLTGGQVDVVAESEGTLGVYAMLDRHPGLPVGSIVLLSPIVDPGQLGYPPGADGASVPEEALDELNNMVGGMSPYGPNGAEQLLSSVNQFGASYFEAAADPSAEPSRLLAVVPLADALTLPVCGLPANVVVVPAFHGGLLGDASVLQMVSAFLAGRPATVQDEGEMRDAAEAISSAATAWRMPDSRFTCPG